MGWGLGLYRPINKPIKAIIGQSAWGAHLEGAPNEEWKLRFDERIVLSYNFINRGSTLNLN